jgi:predicted chitinase
MIKLLIVLLMLSGNAMSKKEDKEDKEALIKQISRERGLSGDKLNQFMAQVKKETGNFNRFEESPHYSVDRMRKMFPSKTKGKSDEDLKKVSPLYTGTKEKFFDLVYSNRKNLGTGDKEGSKYYGRGPIQLTGKYNYEKYKADPSKMNDLRYATEKSVDYFKDISKGIEDEKDTDEFSSAVNKYDKDSFDTRRKYYNQYAKGQKEIDLESAEGNAALGNTESFKQILKQKQEALVDKPLLDVLKIQSNKNKEEEE